MKLPRKESEKVEFKLSFDKEAIESLCAFANARGGSVFVGVNDRGKPVGADTGGESMQQWVNQVKHTTSPSLVPDIEEIPAGGKMVVVVTVPEYPIKPVSCRGRYYKRVGNSNHLLDLPEISSMYLRTYNTSWDACVTNDRSPGEISLEKVQRFIDLANRIRENGITDDPLTVLRKFDLLKGESVTNACHLLFASGDVFSAAVHIGRFSDPVSIKDELTVRSDLFNQIDSVLGFVKKHLNKAIIITGNPQHEERWQYPLGALREIIINMIVHREYRNSGDSIVKIFNDRIEFFNPGGLPDGLTVKQLLSGNYLSHVRNKKVATIFKEAGIIEQYGSGISRVIRAFDAYGLTPPLFENFQHGFRVTVFSNPKDVVENGIENVVENDAGKEAEIMDCIAHDGTLSTAGIARRLGSSQRSIQRHIKALQEKKAIRRVGPDKGGRWEVNGYKATPDTSKNVVEDVIENVVENGPEKETGIMDCITRDGTLSATGIARRLGISQRSVQRRLKALRNTKAIRRVGPDKGGRWEVMPVGRR